MAAEPALVEGRTVAVNGERYLVRNTGGDGPPVLLLHGWPDDSTLWRHQQSALTGAGYRTIAVDWPFHGGSSRPARVARCATPRLTRDTVDLLDALRIDTAHLVAHDYGATVSWETVAAHPARFRTFTAISVGHSAEVLRDVLTGSLLRYHWLLLHGLPVSVPYYLADDARRFRARFASHPDADAVLHRLRTGDTTFFTVWERANPAPAVLARHLAHRAPVRVPTLGIYSRDDEWMTPGQMARSGARVAAPWRHRLVDGGHWVPLQHPDAVTGAVLEFLTEHRTPAGRRPARPRPAPRPGGPGAPPAR